MKIRNKIIIILLILILTLVPNCKVLAVEELSVNANAAILVETNTGKVIYEKDSKEQNFPASVTKVLTAILVLENCNLDDVATASQTALSGIPSAYVVTPLSVGEKMRIEDLLYALMLKSANDAAYVLAEHVGGSIEGFANMMNEKAKEIGCEHTHFVNPNGIHNDNHYTTAYDMYLISQYAMQNNDFVRIVSTHKYTLPATNKYTAANRVMENTNSFIDPQSKFYNPDIKGIKTGTTTQAGNCLITSGSKDGIDIITVVLGAKTADSKFTESSKMIDYAFNNYTFTKMHAKSDVIRTIEVAKATEKTKYLDLAISDEIEVLNKKELAKEDIKPEIKINENITAPITEGQELGTISYSVEGIEYNAKLIATKNVEKRTYEKEIGLAIIIGIILLILIHSIKKKKRKR